MGQPTPTKHRGGHCSSGGGGHLQALMADCGSSCRVSHPCDTWARVFMDEEAMQVAKSKLAPEPRSLLPSAPSCWSRWLMAGAGAPGPLARWGYRSRRPCQGCVGPVIPIGWGPWWQELSKGKVPPPWSPRYATSFYMPSHSCGCLGM